MLKVEFVFSDIKDEVHTFAEVPEYVMENYSGFFIDNGHLFVSFDSDAPEVFDDGYTCEVFYKNISIYDCGSGYDHLKNLTPYYHIEY